MHTVKPPRAVFVDATPTLADAMKTRMLPGDMPIQLSEQPDVQPAMLPGLLGDAPIMLIDHSRFPTDVAKQCPSLKHIVFLGVGAASYMNIAELAAMGITVHLIRGYGDTSVAECAFSLMWAGAKGLASMDRDMRQGRWSRTEGIELKGKCVGLIGFGGIAAEMARLCLGCGMKVTAWNRSPKTYDGVVFAPLDDVLAASDVVSLHLLLSDETAGILSREKIQRMRPGALLINTARGALVDEAALIEALQSGRIRHAGFDVYAVEPLPQDHPLLALPNVTLSAHSAFRTPEATANLVNAALAHCRRLAGQA
ncbi:dehydrogenase [Deltaproteobacteria bacterium]|nr:dehydrogenase [Deltaproteobacteria bacterium]